MPTEKRENITHWKKLQMTSVKKVNKSHRQTHSNITNKQLRVPVTAATVIRPGARAAATSRLIAELITNLSSAGVDWAGLSYTALGRWHGNGAASALMKRPPSRRRASLSIRRASLPIRRASVPRRRASVPRRRASLPHRRASLPHRPAFFQRWGATGRWPTAHRHRSDWWDEQLGMCVRDRLHLHLHG